MRKDTLELFIRNLRGIIKSIEKKDVKLLISHLKGIVTILEKEKTQEKQSI